MTTQEFALRNGKQAAAWFVRVVLVLSCVAVASQLFSLISLGPTHEYSVHFVALGLLPVVYALICYWLVTTNRHASATVICAWATYVSVFGMAFLDSAMVRDGRCVGDYPVVVWLASISICILYLVNGQRATSMYTVAYSVACAALTLIYSDISDLVPPALMTVTFLFLGRQSRLWSEENRAMHAKISAIERLLDAMNGRSPGTE